MNDVKWTQWVGLTANMYVCTFSTSQAE